MRGGEKVFEVLCELYPQADVYTLFYEPEKVSPLIRSMHVREALATRCLPGARSHYRYLLPFMPSMIESFSVRNYDVVISTSHCVAKGIEPRPASTPHICYCFTPMRYVWDKYDDYFGDRTRPASWLMRLFRKHLQHWDVETAGRITQFLTSSNYVRDRIRKCYLREAHVIPPPVDCERFAHNERHPEDFFLVASALEPYKRIDVAIEAFRRLGLPLKVAGSGSQFKRLKRNAPPNVEFLGWVSDADLAALYSCARALVFPSDEDFGIVPLEASASGCPVIAYGHGGALETIVDGVTGMFFGEQTAESLVSAVRRFDIGDYKDDTLRRHAHQFDRPIFKQHMSEAIDSYLKIGALL